MGKLLQARLYMHLMSEETKEVKNAQLTLQEQVELQKRSKLPTAHLAWTSFSETFHGRSRDQKRGCLFPQSTPFPTLNCGASSRRMLNNHFFPPCAVQQMKDVKGYFVVFVLMFRSQRQRGIQQYWYACNLRVFVGVSDCSALFIYLLLLIITYY